MGDVVNLKRFKKRTEREQSAKQAESNRARYGRTKSQRALDEKLGDRASACPRLQENSCWTDPDDLAAASISPGSGFSNPREHLICNDRALALVRTSQDGQSRVFRRHFGP